MKEYPLEKYQKQLHEKVEKRLLRLGWIGIIVFLLLIFLFLINTFFASIFTSKRLMFNFYNLSGNNDFNLLSNK